jgi:hypothetical protein
MSIDPMVNDNKDASSIVFSLNLFVMYAVGGIITASTMRNTEYVSCAVVEGI